mmetsp:Transcript_19105/g.54250  ORF Transcript_19105/g.54250 Transcript_19105/m.54250 type:complete len:1116 (-) Transcript_19105:109-3456(-)
MSARKPLHKKDHLRLATNANTVAFTGDIVPGAFNVQNGRMRQRPQIATDSYSPYVESTQNEMRQQKQPAPPRFDYASSHNVEGSSRVGNATFVPASSNGLAEATPVSADPDRASQRQKQDRLSLWEVEQIKEEAEQNVQRQVQSTAVEAQEYDEKEAQAVADMRRRKKRRRCIATVLFFVLLAVAALVVGLILGLRDDGGSKGTTKAVEGIDVPDLTSVPTQAPTIPPNVTDTNVDCPNAIGIAVEKDETVDDFSQNISLIGSTQAALEEVSDQTPVCGPQVVENGLGMWYRFPGDNQVWTISLCGTDEDEGVSTTFDSQLSIFESSIGKNECSEMECRASNDQFCGDRSQVTFTSVVGKMYFIYIHGYRDQRGLFHLNMYPEKQDHFSCDKAKKEDSSWNELVGSTFEMTEALEGDDADAIPKLTCNADGTPNTANPLPGLWYEMTGTGNVLTVSTCSDTATYDAKISVVTAGGGGGCDGGDVFQCVAILEEVCPTGLGRIISFPSVASTQYHAIVHGPPEQDDDGEAESNARRQRRNLDDLESPIITLRGNLARTLQDNATDDNVTAAFLSADQFEVGLTIVDNVPPGTFLYKPRERCQDATVLDITTSNSTAVLGSIQPSPPLTLPPSANDFGGKCGDATYGMAPGVWYSVVGNGQIISATTCDESTNFDTQITVFEGDCFITPDVADQGDVPLQCVTGNDQSACGSSSFVEWQSELGVVYRILVHGYGSRVGDFALIVSTTFTEAPSPSPSSVPSENPTTSPSATPTITKSMNPTQFPTTVPSSQPSTYPSTPMPTTLGSDSPTVSLQPSIAPTVTPSISPSSTPSVLPSMSPSSVPSINPTSTPTLLPSMLPSIVASMGPTSNPSIRPTSMPSSPPSALPSAAPTLNPTTSPTMEPSETPSAAPTASPTMQPTNAPTSMPTSNPTSMPTSNPTSMPTNLPTTSPTMAPTANPTTTPTVSPSAPPTFLYTVEDACASAGTLDIDGGAEVGTIDPIPNALPIDSINFQGTCSASTFTSPWGAWYSFNGNNRLTAIDSCSEITSIELQITVFQRLPSADGKLCSNLQCVAGNDTPCGLVWFEALFGQQYFIFIHPVNPGETGTYLLNIQDQAL